jgi:hypothetical protein
VGENLLKPISNSNATSEDGQPRKFPQEFETLLRMDPENSVLQILKSQTSQKNLDPWETCSVYILKLGKKFYLFAQNNNKNIEKELFEVRANLLTLQSTTNNPYSQKTIDSHPSLDRKIFGTSYCKFLEWNFGLEFPDL